MKVWRRLLLAAALVCLPTGCNLEWPTWRLPAPLHRQQAGASLHDPYPDTNLAPPIEGGRPREFAQPRAEPIRAQLWPNAHGGDR